MLLNKVFDRFARYSPVTVMMRGISNMRSFVATG